MKDNPIPTFHNEIVRIEEEAIAKADRVIVLSDSQRELLFSRYTVTNVKKIYLIPHSINFTPKKFSDLNRAKKATERIKILFVGRIEHDKGIVELLEAFIKLEDLDNIELHIVGDGPLLKELKEQNKLKNVFFYGYQDRSNLEKLLSDAHIFCMPSSSENLPLTVLEAMFFGVVPIFTSGKSVPKIYRDGVEGLTIKLRNIKGQLRPDVNDIYNALKRLISQSDLRNQLSRNAYTLAIEKYSSEAMIGKIAQIYRLKD